jgi:hypothetical protein
MYSVQSLMSVKERTLRILSGQCIHMSSLTSKSIKVIYFSRDTSLQSLKPVKKRFSRYWFICPVWPLDLWHFNLKICSGYLLSMLYKSTKFEVCQAKGSQDIEWSIYSYIQFDPLTFHLLTSKSIMVIYFSWCTSLQSLNSVKQRVLKILRSQYTHMSSLTPWSLTS